MSDKSSQPETAPMTQGAGTRLKEARTRLGFTLKDVASQLNLKTEIIEALENGDDDRLPESTYVRGYIRSYAKIVKIDGNELINLYENYAASPPEIIPDIKSHIQATSHDKPVRAVTYLVTFILALLLVAWLQGNYIVKTDVTTADDQESSEKSDYSTSNKTDAPNDTDGDVYYYPGINLDDYDRSKTQPGKSTDPSIKTPPNPDLPDLSGMDEGEELSPDDETNSPVSTSVTSDRLELKLNGDSWVEVTDVSRKLLYKDLARTGEEINISGAAPFTILLGYSPVVEVSFNGRSIDTTPYTDSGIARFKLGE